MVCFQTFVSKQYNCKYTQLQVGLTRYRRNDLTQVITICMGYVACLWWLMNWWVCQSVQNWTLQGNTYCHKRKALLLWILVMPTFHKLYLANQLSEGFFADFSGWASTVTISLVKLSAWYTLGLWSYLHFFSQPKPKNNCLFFWMATYARLLGCNSHRYGMYHKM